MSYLFVQITQENESVERAFLSAWASSKARSVKASYKPSNSYWIANLQCTIHIVAAEEQGYIDSRAPCLYKQTRFVEKGKSLSMYMERRRAVCRQFVCI